LPPQLGRASLAATALLLVGQASAQQPTVWVDALASSARPLTGLVEQPVGVYGLIGARAQWNTREFDLGASGFLGSGARQEYGRWGALAATASTGRPLGPLQGDLEFDVFALHYSSPSRYSAISVTTRPALSYRLRGLDLVAGGEFGIGHWGSQTDAAPVDPVDPTAPVVPGTVERGGKLRVTGARASIAAPLANGTVALGGSVARAQNERAGGRYRGANLSALQIMGDWDIMLEGQVQAGPERTELGGLVRAGRAIGEQLYASAEYGRRVTDYTLGAGAHNSATFGISWRPGAQRRAFRIRPTVVRVMYRETRGTRVEFRLPRTAASSVALVGSFTEWEPRAMERTEEGWKVTLLLPEGSHQFAFLLDGRRWYLPEGAPGVVDDGFGRKNATVVISPS
jgi:AMP-activated protein kinase-like protein